MFDEMGSQPAVSPPKFMIILLKNYLKLIFIINFDKKYIKKADLLTVQPQLPLLTVQLTSSVL